MICVMERNSVISSENIDFLLKYLAIVSQSDTI